MNKRHSNEFLADIRSALLEVMTRVYLNEAPQNKTYPFCVFEADVMYNGFKVTVDIWGKSGAENEAHLLDQADLIEAALDGLIIANEYHTSMFASNQDMQWIRDEDPTIKRIQLSFYATYQS